MELSLQGITDVRSWNRAGIKLPNFDIEKVRKQTRENPEWIHFGAGNIFRGFIGSISQSLLNQGYMESGIAAVESFDFEIIDRIYNPYDSLTLNVMMGKNADFRCEVLAGVCEGMKSYDYARIYEIAEKPSLKIISLTITEKGYTVKDINENIIPIVTEDIKNGTDKPKHTMSIIAAMLYRRYKSCSMPVAVVSMDNCSHNGERLKNGVMTVINAWIENGVAEKAFADYIENSVSFPWSMIDKITPRPDNSVKARLEAMGVKNMDIIVTKKGTYISPFVNAEIPQYLVIEDSFPNGRPPLEKAGVYMTTRETVNKAEIMKVTTCLNPLHTGLAVFGCLLGYKSIWEEMNDKELAKLVNMIADEGIKVVINPQIINPADFISEVINERLPNPHIPDTPQRIATDTSQKLSVRYGETMKAYVKSDKLNVAELKAIPVVIAGWLRYLLAVDDNGNEFGVSPDPMLENMQNKLKGIKLGNVQGAEEALKSILSNKNLFGVNLYEIGLGERIEQIFKRMANGIGAIREELKCL